MAVLFKFLVTVLLEYIDLLSVSIYLKSAFSALAPYIPFTGADPEFGKGGYTSTLLKKVADQKKWEVQETVTAVILLVYRLSLFIISWSYIHICENSFSFKANNFV